MTESLLFYDLETWGLDARNTRIAQFAAIRTNAALEEIESPHSFFIKPADDFLPCPDSALITGITPQRAEAEGIVEAEALHRIHALMAEPGTCTLGYNTLKFDDSFIRYGLYRNFHDAYEREYAHGNSRWDMFNVIRAVRALRPEGLQWRTREDLPDATSYKLEHLAEDNGLRTGSAHEALSDVRATVGLARLVMQAQPKLWHYLQRLRDKRQVQSLIDLNAMTPMLHVAGHYPAAQQHTAMVVPIAEHPVNKNQFILLRVDTDPESLAALDADTLRERYFARRDALPEGVERPGFTSVRINESPTLIPLTDLRAPDLERLKIDMAEVEAHAVKARALRARLTPLARDLFTQTYDDATTDVDAALFNGFIGAADKALFPRIRSCPPDKLGTEGFRFQDARMPDLFFRYRARNWPYTLNFDEAECWQGHRIAHLVKGVNAPYTFATHAEKTAVLREKYADDPAKLAILDAMDAWRDSLHQSLGH